MKSEIYLIDNPFALSEADARRLQETPQGGHAQVAILEKDGVRKRVRLALRNASDTDSSCRLCGLFVTRWKSDEGHCPYWRLCFATQRPDKKSVYFYQNATR